MEFFDIPMSKDILQEVQDGKCFYCGEKKDNLTRDHFYPKCQGNRRLGNIVLACYDCNTKKGGKLPNDEQVLKFREIQYQVYSVLWERR